MWLFRALLPVKPSYAWSRCEIARTTRHSKTSSTGRYVDRKGTGQLANLPTRVLWYPWSIEALVHWTRFAQRSGLPPETIYALRRSMSHLVVNLAPMVRVDVSRGVLFMRAETHSALVR